MISSAVNCLQVQLFITHDFGGEHGATVVIEFVLVENDLVEEEDLLPQFQSFVVDS